MIWGVLALSLAALSVIGGLLLWCRSMYGDVTAGRDLFDKQCEVTRSVERDRDGYKAQADARAIALKETQDRLAVAESQRNQALAQGAQDVVNKIKAGGVADAAAEVERLSGSNGSVPPHPAASPAVPGHDHRDDLEKPV